MLRPDALLVVTRKSDGMMAKIRVPNHMLTHEQWNTASSVRRELSACCVEDKPSVPANALFCLIASRWVLS